MNIYNCMPGKRLHEFYYTGMPGKRLHDADTVDFPGDDRLPSFSAYAAIDRYYNESDVVIFDVVISNFGESYLQPSNVFMCPVHGVYMFNVNLITRLGLDMIGQIYLNGETAAGFFARGETESTGSALVIIECFEGDKVWVRNGPDNSHMDGGGIRHSIFSGTLLQAL